MSGVERRRHRAAFDADGLGDVLVVEVCVVAEKEHEPLPLRKRGDRGPQLERLLSAPVRLGLADLLETGDGMAFLDLADVYQRSPQPSVETLDAMQVAP